MTSPHRTTVRDVAAIACARVGKRLLRSVLDRGGSAIPGAIVNAIAPALMARVLTGFDLGLVVVTGSSGKSTTTKMLAELLGAHGLRVFTNSSTANMPQGIASAIVDESTWTGRVPADIAVIEIDEAVAARMAPGIRPDVVVLTNVMLDSLERFGSARRIAILLASVARHATRAVVANSDDALIVECTAGAEAPVSWFTARSNVTASVPSGLGYAEHAVRNLPPTAPATFVTEVTDGRASLDSRGDLLNVKLPSRGIHFAMDAAAAVEAARVVLGDRFDRRVAVRAFEHMLPVFGRGEIVSIAGQEVELVLVQNLSSFQLNLDQLDPVPERLMVAVGSDVADPSWLWSVDTSRLRSVDVVSGSRAYEIAIRLAYGGTAISLVEQDVHDAMDAFLALPAPGSGRKTIVFSPDSMRRIRRDRHLASSSAIA